jgi:hypothetical protein
MNTAKIRRILVGTPEKTQTGWEVPSLITGEIYEIELSRWGRWTCTCLSSERPCKHVRRVLAMLEDEQEVAMIS